MAPSNPSARRVSTARHPASDAPTTMTVLSAVTLAPRTHEPNIAIHSSAERGRKT